MISVRNSGLFLLLFCFVSSAARAQNRVSKKLDSLYTLLGKTFDENKKAKVMAELGWALVLAVDYEQARLYAASIICFT